MRWMTVFNAVRFVVSDTCAAARCTPSISRRAYTHSLSPELIFRRSLFILFKGNGQHIALSPCC